MLNTGSNTDIEIPKHQGTKDLLLVIVDTKFVSLIRGALKTNFLFFRYFVLTSLCSVQSNNYISTAILPV